MKKFEYVSPEMEIVEIKTQCILAASDPTVDDDKHDGEMPPGWPGK